MPRFYVSPEVWNQSEIVLDDAETHHAVDVLRLKPGDHAVVFNGRGIEAPCEFVSLTKSGAVLRPGRESRSPALPCRITLGQAIPKGRNMDLIVQKATELGATGIVPIISDRTIIRLDANEARQKQIKWRETAIEACKQCGQNWLPEIETPISMKSFFAARPRYDLMLIASLQPESRPLKHWLAEAGSRARSVLVLVGPEGDFTPAELGLARSEGCFPLTLGPIILRTETAAIYVVSILSHELQAE